MRGRSASVAEPGVARVSLEVPESPQLQRLSQSVQRKWDAAQLLDALIGSATGASGTHEAIRELAPKFFEPGSWEADANRFGAALSHMDAGRIHALKAGLAAAMSAPHDMDDAALMVIRSLCEEASAPPLSPC